MPLVQVGATVLDVGALGELAVERADDAVQVVGAQEGIDLGINSWTSSLP
jgi:hypothetical protein